MLTINFDELLNDYKEQRASLKEMVKSLELFKDEVNKLLPDSFNARHKFLFEEKIKVVTELFKAILEMRKEITKSIKDEIEIRRKLNDSREDDDDFKKLDVRSLAKEIERINKETEEDIDSFKNINKSEGVSIC